MNFKHVVFVLVLACAAAAHPKEDFQCPSVGRFPDVSDCSKYYVCLNTAWGLEAGWSQCPPGSFFHPESLTCRDMIEAPHLECRRQVQDRMSREYKKPEITGQEADEKCEEQDGEICGYCKQIISCQLNGGNITGSPIFCGDDEYCLQFNDPTNGRLAGCFTKCVDCECSTPPDAVLRPDMYDDRTYFTCDDYVNKGQRFFRCPDGQTFDPDDHKCVYATVCTTEGLNCTNVGFFVLEADCRQYYHCHYEVVEGALNMTVECNICDQGQYFYPDLGCKSASEFECESAGEFEDVADCTSYHLCVPFGEEFLHSHTSCPDNSHFDPLSGHCVPGDCVPKCSGTLSDSGFYP